MVSRARSVQGAASIYNHQHRELREQWKPYVLTGTILCPYAECPVPDRRITPTSARGNGWDMGHNPTNPTAAPVPWHSYCNRAEAARRINTQRKRPRFRRPAW